MSLRETILAIQLLHPEANAHFHAEIIEAAARRARVDALALVALVQHESGFRVEAVSSDGEDYGLGQVRARFRPACRQSIESQACKEEKRKLVSDPRYNLQVIAGAIRASKKGKKCKAKTTIGCWVAALAGTQPSHPKVREVEELYRQVKRATRSALAERSTFRRRSSKRR